MIRGEFEQQSGSIWVRLWKLKVPAKVKNFLWRACSNCLPTADVLRARRVQIDEVCPVCLLQTESALQILVECVLARECWLLAAVGMFRSGMASFHDWVCDFFTSHNLEECEMMAMICWILWKNRNEVVWNAKGSNARYLVNAAGRFLNEWKAAQVSNVQIMSQESGTGGDVVWTKPRSGWLKANVDAALFAHVKKVGFGCIVRDADGNMVAAFSKVMSGSFGPKEAEAIGVREALSWLKGKQWDHILMEMDAQQVVMGLRSSSSGNTAYGFR